MIDELGEFDELKEFESSPPTTFLHVGRAGEKFPDGFLRFHSVDVPSDSSEAISSYSDVFFVKQIGDHYMAHVPIVNGETLKSSTAWDSKKCTGYLLVELRVKEDSIELRYFDPTFLDQLTKEKKIQIDNSKPKSKLVTNTPESIEEILASNGDKLFSPEVEIYKRLKLKDESKKKQP